ncbi:MAG: hypothetical protein WCD02_12630 [Terriglobales bacterium]
MLNSIFTLIFIFIFILLLILTTGSLLAQSSAFILYPDQGTTINGEAAYMSGLLVAGDRVRTATAMSKITANGMELEMSPNSSVTIGEPLILNCGSIVVRSGTIAITDGLRTSSLVAGQSAPAAFSAPGDMLRDAPVGARCEMLPSSSPLDSRQRRSRSAGAAPTASAGILDFYSPVADWSYWTVQGAMFGSSVVAAEKTQTCLQAGACSFVPNAFQTRAVMYGAGLPTAAGVSYLGYYLKKRHSRWWFVPAALVTAGNIVVSAHAAKYSH